jgi:acyl-CoA synthetase (AMP-forming)/AMP-acid ligase II
MNVTMLLDMAADGLADRMLVGRRSEGLTAAELRRRAVGGASLAEAVGADAVVYLAVNGPAFPVALFAAARAGVPLVPVNYRLGAEQLDAVLAHHPAAVAIAEPAHAGALARAGLAHRTPQQWLADTAAAGPADGAEADPVFVEPESTAVIIYTSGTTSEPKGVLLRHENLASYVLGTVEFGGAEEMDASLVSVPPYHIAAVSNTLTNLYAGRRAIVLEPFTPAGWLELVRAEQVTHAMVVPTMLARIMDAAEGEGLDVTAPSLRSLAYGGAKTPLRVIRRALAAWPHVDFVNAYGLTETSSTISVLGPEDHRAALESDAASTVARLASAGRPVPGVEIEIRTEEGDPAPAGVPGQIWVRGDQVSGRYAGRDSALQDGWFYTRDHGHLDDEGYLFISGRVDDTIIRGAENIAPAEIEDVLLRQPGVADAVVVGVPDDEWGQRIEAVVVPAPGTTVDQESLRSACHAVLRGSKTPERIASWPELPRTPVGKLIRRDVVAALAVGHTPTG